MERLERFFKIDQLLRTHRCVTREKFLETLEVSLATFKRDLEYLRDRFHAPIDFDRQLGGYCYTEGAEFNLPGLWLNEAEIHALLSMQHLLGDLQPGILDDHVRPLMKRIQSLLEIGDHSVSEINKRTRLITIASRPVSHGYFEMLTSALLKRRQLKITYYNRAEDRETIRVVSPQRMVHYRDNWYLDAWCHLRNALRTFAMESIRKAEMREDPARDVTEDTLDAVLGSGYGIFSGEKVQQATLRFSPSTARWVESERWHPQQRSRYDADGYYHLTIPYSDDRELIQDILKYGANVTVLEPAELRGRVKHALTEALAQYG